MENPKKIAWAIVLGVVVVVAITFTIVKTLGLGEGKPPARVTGVEVTKVDVDTLEVITRTEGEWMDLGQKKGMYKNPDTGKYTMRAALTCPHCNETIPTRALRTGNLTVEERMELAKTPWLCPRCNEPVVADSPQR